MGDVVLVKKNNVARKNLKKGKTVPVIRGKDIWWGAEIYIFQLIWNRTVAIDKPLQLVVSFETNKAEYEIKVTHLKRNAAIYQCRSNIKISSV